MSDKIDPQSPEDVTALCKREFAIQALWLLQGTINHLRSVGLHDEARG
jgi:hypothetical protein